MKINLNKSNINPQFDYMAEVAQIVTKAAKIAIANGEYIDLRDAKRSIKESIAENLLEEIH